ncbi:PREDICTED: uncharacterized protein LOC104602720 [Nelumbo nucifera]|uniref:Uncharacterized protein n=2 Tax=Nelumbo nucifera TaxID=4432 RepID=A0A822XLN5_NELNU|nr:PREDICTED: uncharacterized protein LOC104602720 [Nelumbo nucifera]DAD20101.1 TPA_asm: hypothetical protein HUJ06_021564 [Nelumbo nucifera]
METRLFAFPFLVSAPSMPPRSPSFSPARNPNYSAHVLCCSRYRPRRSDGSDSSYWNSNAEPLRRKRSRFGFGEESINEDDDDGIGFRRRYKQRKWWSDRPSSWDNDRGTGVFEEVIDSFWILKVFSSFGWALPVIILSMLIASGPKAFLMALALPLGQSAISLAIDKLWGGTRDSPKRRSKTKKNPFARTPRDAQMSEEEKQEEIGGTGNGRYRYQSWVAANYGSDKGGQYESGFGGWDELDRRGKPDKEPTKMPLGTGGGISRPQVEKKGKLSRKGRNKSTPLLLRLLIAVFPFLGSWTKLL